MQPTAPASLRTQTVELPSLVLRADISAVDRKTRTVELIFSTGAPVTRFDWMSGATYVETLSLKPEAVRLDRLNAGAPLLNTHGTYDLRDVIGAVVPASAKVDGKQGTATVRFSKRADVEPIFQDVEDKIIRNVSVGYKVHKYVQTEATEGQPARRHAVDWEPFEISAVPIGADAGAQMRSEEQGRTKTPCLIITRAAGRRETPIMDAVLTPEQQAQAQRDQEAAEAVDELARRQVAGDLHPPVPAPVPAQPTDRDAGVLAERARCEGITQATRAARLPQAFGDDLIKTGVSLVDAQSRVFAEMAKTEAGPSRIPSGAGYTGAGEDHAMAAVWRGIENALLHRISPDRFELSEVGKRFNGLSLLETARKCLQVRGVRTDGLSKMELAGLACGFNIRAGYHTTSDFPNILADVLYKNLRRAYDEAPQTFTTIARRTELPDFRARTEVQLGEAPALLKVLEHGEFTRGTIGEGKEAYQLATYGRIFAITRKALVNDDTDAFGRLPMLYGRAARNLESDLVWEQITSNPTMGDSVALFDAAHANLGTAAVISIASLSEARKLMRLQKGVDGVQVLNLTPRFLVVPGALETVADQFVTQITPALAGSVNPFSGRLQVVVEPRLDAASATAWYLVADPSQIDTLVYAFLAGENGPAIDTRNGFEVDGVETKARHDFAAKVIDWRGFVKNAGA